MQGKRRVRDALVVTVGLAVGIAAPRVVDAVTDRSDNKAPAQRAAAVKTGPIPKVNPAAPDETFASTPAPSPAEAVERFLTAEADSDHARSFGLLSAADRATYRSPTAWRAAHATILPVVGFDVRNVADTRVVTDVRYRSTIDEVVGLVPARANVAWPVVAEDGGWLVDFSKAEVDAQLPPDAEALTMAGTWAAQRQKCAPAEEYRAGLVGRITLATKLCRARGELTVGEVARLDTSIAAPFVSAFGASAPALARTVQLAGPVPMTVVLAPIEDRWLVIGVLDPA